MDRASRLHTDRTDVGWRPARLSARRKDRIRGAGEKTLRDTSTRATKASYPALSLCDLIFSGVFERHPRLLLAISANRADLGIAMETITGQYELGSVASTIPTPGVNVAKSNG
jgi:hypothetical protein